MSQTAHAHVSDSRPCMFPLKKVTGARIEDLWMFSEAMRDALVCLYQAHNISHGLLPEHSAFAIDIIDEIEHFLGEKGVE